MKSRKAVVKPTIVSKMTGELVPRPDAGLERMWRSSTYGKEDADATYRLLATMATSSIYGKFVPYNGPDPEIELMTEELANARKNRQ